MQSAAAYLEDVKDPSVWIPDHWNVARDEASEEISTLRRLLLSPSDDMLSDVRRKSS